MKIEEGNANKTIKIDKRLSISTILALVIFMISGSAATITYATPQTLPTCVDPTGHNLPCIMFISTLPPPMHTLQCQETSGQIFKCTYIVDKLSNGNEIVAITVYVPANFVFSSPTIIKVIAHEMTTSSTTGGGSGDGQNLSHKLFVAIGIAKDPIVRGNIQTITVTVADSKKQSMKIASADVNGEVTYVTGHQEPLTGATNDQGIYSHLWRISGDATPGKFKVEVHASADGKSGSATKTFAVIPKTNTTITPINMTKDNITVAGSVGKGTTCAAGNCTTGTPPPVDCKINPNDPSCTQTLQPLTPPTTKTCPDGLVIDTSASCPTQSTPPSPTNNNPPPTENNPTPPSDNGNNNPPSGGSGSSNGGGTSGSGSNPPSPSTLQ
jgi:hypothetical protein